MVVVADTLPHACDLAREQLQVLQAGWCGPLTNADHLIQLLSDPSAVGSATTTSLGEHPELMEPDGAAKSSVLTRTRMQNTLDYFTYVMTNQTLGLVDKATHPGARGPMPVSAQPRFTSAFGCAGQPTAGLLQVLYPQSGQGLQVDRSRPQPQKLVQHLLTFGKVIIMDTTRRDGQQSLIATRAGDCELLSTLDAEVLWLVSSTSLQRVLSGPGPCLSGRLSCVSLPRPIYLAMRWVFMK